MVRFANLVVLAGILIVAGCAMAPVGHADATKIPVINGRVTLDQFDGLVVNPSLKDCRSNRCVTLRSLVHSYDTLQRFYTPNSMAQTKPARQPSTRPVLPIQTLLLAQPALHHTATVQLVTIAQGVPEWTHELLTIEIATLISQDGRAVRAVMKSVPKTTALAGITTTARQLCVAHHEPHCAMIRREAAQ